MLRYLLAPKLCQYFYRLYSLWCFGSHLKRCQVAGNSSRLKTILFVAQKTKRPRGIHSKSRFQPLIKESKIDLPLPNPFQLCKEKNTG